MKNGGNEYLFNYSGGPDSLFSVLSKEERALLKETNVKRMIKKGGLIFKEGSEPEGLIFLSRGSAKVFKVGVGDREQIVRLVRPMSFVGYKALFAERPHVVSAEAIENSEIIIYNKKILNKIIEQNTAFSKEIIKALANELGFNFNRLINLTQKHIRGRLAETLLLMRDIYGFTEDGRTLNVHFTRENLAHFSNMTTSNAIRTLKRFEEEQLIKAEGKKLLLLNISVLEKICKLG